jgi:hypothetical protein
VIVTIIEYSLTWDIIVGLILMLVDVRKVIKVGWRFVEESISNDTVGESPESKSLIVGNR